MSEFAALIGIDWSDKKHDLCLIETTSGKREASVLWVSKVSDLAVGR